jgi:hypothetical protein
MGFEETLRAITALSGEQVDLEIWGGDDDGAPIGFFSGELRRMPDSAPEESSPIPPAAIAESAEIFLVGDGNFDLWPSRFVSARPMREGHGWIEVRTKDAVLRVGLKRRAWID